MNTTITLRQKALEAALAEGPQMLRYEHEMNYWTLYVHRDGRVSWGNEVNSDSLLIDQDASDFRPVHYLVQVGTGSCGCNCDWCSDGGKYDPSDDEADVYDYAEKRIADAFEDVPENYFYDEQ
jgi:hypothetical protein